MTRGETGARLQTLCQETQSRTKSDCTRAPLENTRVALCKDPEGEIEKLMEGQTVEKVTGEQAQEDAQQ